jgi:membrane-associated phospholipid phosphatase
MMISTPIIGGHYFTDVVAGILVATAVIAASGYLKPSALRPAVSAV